MRYFFTSIFGIITMAFMLVLGRVVFLAVTDDFTWIFVGVGILMPTIVLCLITSAAYSAAKEY